MTLSDEELKDLEATVKTQRYVPFERVELLLRRLEAAERVAAWTCRCRLSWKSWLTGEHGCARALLIEKWKREAEK